MSQRAADPFSVIAREPPALTRAEARALALEHFGLTVSARPLLSERDQNFRLDTEDGRQFVLKIANSAEQPSFTEFQIRALLHIQNRKNNLASPVCVPEILPASNGLSHVNAVIRGEKHVVRVVSYLAGIPFAEIAGSALLSYNLGAYLAHLGRALRDFAYEGADQGLLWDMKRADQLARLLPFIADAALRGQVAECLVHFGKRVLPRFPGLRSQVIHNDFNPDNILIDPQDTSRPVGVIDFGDMQRSPLVVDVAVAASYLRVLEGDPLQYILQFVRGYNSVTRLEGDEIDLLFDLILTRLCATISILNWRASLRGADDPYLQNAASSESSAEDFFRKLLQLPRDDTRDVLRLACAAA